MRTHHRITTIALAAVLALAACSRGSDSTEGGAREGRSVNGSESAQEQSTSVNDTAPHRPGTPSTP